MRQSHIIKNVINFNLIVIIVAVFVVVFIIVIIIIRLVINLIIEGFRAKRAYIDFWQIFIFLQDRANFSQTDLF